MANTFLSRPLFPFLILYYYSVLLPLPSCSTSTAPPPPSPPCASSPPSLDPHQWPTYSILPMEPLHCFKLEPHRPRKLLSNPTLLLEARPRPQSCCRLSLLYLPISSTLLSRSKRMTTPNFNHTDPAFPPMSPNSRLSRNACVPLYTSTTST